jgi:type II secretory pathway pseudopilin PulG
MNATHRIDINRPLRPYAQRKTRLGFSITEMLVVVGIIVLLASLLMVAMARVRDTAKASQTLSIMQNFAASCDAFQTDHGTYPGVIPETVLATSPAQLVAVTVPPNHDEPATGPAPVSWPGTPEPETVGRPPDDR